METMQRRPWNLPGHTVVNFDNYGSDLQPYGYVYFNDNSRVLYASSREVLLHSGLSDVLTADDIRLAKRGVFAVKGQWEAVTEEHIDAALRRLDAAMPGWDEPHTVTDRDYLD